MRRSRTLLASAAQDNRSLPQLAAAATALLAQAEARGGGSRHAPRSRHTPPALGAAEASPSGRPSLLQHPLVAITAAVAVTAGGVVATVGYDISGGEQASQGDWLSWGTLRATSGLAALTSTLSHAGAGLGHGAPAAPASRALAPAATPGAAPPGAVTTDTASATAVEYARSLALLSEHFGEKQPAGAAATRPRVRAPAVDDYLQAQAVLEQHFDRKR